MTLGCRCPDPTCQAPVRSSRNPNHTVTCHLRWTAEEIREHYVRMLPSVSVIPARIGDTFIPDRDGNIIVDGVSRPAP